MTRIAIYCDRGHARFTVAEWCWFDTQPDDNRRFGYWREHGFGIEQGAADGDRTKQIYRVLTPGADRGSLPPLDYTGPRQGQYRFHCSRCGFNEVRNDGGVRSGDLHDEVSEVTRALLKIFGRLYDHGIEEIEVRSLIRLAWG
ncbi:hypothetical protein DSM43518_04564 [Mycobacterium marinum]|nr:hypothetical protein DSM43518_04564 [Mycobacterium marinum]